MTNHAWIWLAPDCDCWRNTGEGRLWCEDREPLECEEKCGKEPVAYVRADLVEKMKGVKP